MHDYTDECAFALVAHSTGQQPSNGVIMNMHYGYEIPSSLLALCQGDEEEKYDEVVGMNEYDDNDDNNDDNNDDEYDDEHDDEHDDNDDDNQFNFIMNSILH